MLYYDKTLACDDSVVTKLGPCYAFILDLFLQRHKSIPDVIRHIDDASFLLDVVPCEALLTFCCQTGWIWLA